MDADGFPSLVAPEWLARNLATPRLRVVDASWHLPSAGRDAQAEFDQRHIPGAVFFDIDRVADPHSELPHMLPAEQGFAEAVGALGIGNDDRVVVYDSHGLFSAARAWWMFRVFGHAAMAILDGGLPAWIEAGGALEQGRPSPRPRAFRARLDAGRVWTLTDVRRNLESGEAQLLDARPADRFAGRAAEPRPGLRAGHIPGAANIPFDRLTDPATGRLRSPGDLAERFAVADGRPVVCSCGTGVTACALVFGLHLLGREDVAVYDGSWTEWGGRDDTPVAGGD